MKVKTCRTLAVLVALLVIWGATFFIPCHPCGIYRLDSPRFHLSLVFVIDNLQGVSVCHVYERANFFATGNLYRGTWRVDDGVVHLDCFGGRAGGAEWHREYKLKTYWWGLKLDCGTDLGKKLVAYGRRL